jgi:hypothetical protein
MAWTDTGHMLVAAIAEDNLKPDVKKEVSLLFVGDMDAKTNNFITAACWADDTKSEKKTGAWHYINLHFRTDGKSTSNKPEAENAVWAINQLSKVLADGNETKAKRLEALKYIIHFVGDLHQPLHCVARDTDADPKGDRGGNAFKITPPDGMQPSPNNLHFLWDLGGGLFPRIARPMFSSSTIATFVDLKTRITMQNPMKSFPQVSVLDPMTWANEGLELAKSTVYKLDENTVPSSEYFKTCQKVSAQQVALGGYRLAALLNKLLGS